MNIAQAIEILTNWQDGLGMPAFWDVGTAVKLSIEALKCFQGARAGNSVYLDQLLPGETEE